MFSYYHHLYNILEYIKYSLGWCLTLHILYSIIFKNQEVNKVLRLSQSHVKSDWLNLNHKQMANHILVIKVNKKVVVSFENYISKFSVICTKI